PAYAWPVSDRVTRGAHHPPARVGARGVGGSVCAVRAAGVPCPAGPRPPRRHERGDRGDPRHRPPEAGVSDTVRRLRRDRGARSRTLDQPAVRGRARHPHGRGRAPQLRGPGDLPPLPRRGGRPGPAPTHHAPAPGRPPPTRPPPPPAPPPPTPPPPPPPPAP